MNRVPRSIRSCLNTHRSARLCARAGACLIAPAVLGACAGLPPPDASIEWMNHGPPIVRVSIESPSVDPGATLRIGLGDRSMRVPALVAPHTEDETVTLVGAFTLDDPGIEKGVSIEALDARGVVLVRRRAEIPAAPDPGSTPPDWAKGLLWYQVFPERFANANPSNDPTRPDGTLVAWDQPFHEPTILEIDRAWFRAAGEPTRFGIDPDATGGVMRRLIFQRRYGGDLQGVLARLDHLASLGVDGVYLCPVFDSSSLHKYDAADHRHIDPSLANPEHAGAPDPARPELVGDPGDETTWGWSVADRWFLDEFVAALRARGMRLMLDGVWNHVGVDHWAFRDVVEKGRRSAYADWFEVAFDEHGSLVAWEAWDGLNGDLPEFRQIDGDLAPGPKAHIFAVTRRWMDPDGDGDPSDGIDAWRLDVAGEIGRAFWKDWRALVREINPGCLIVGEIWSDAGDYFDGTAFDAQMNYPGAYAVADWLAIGTNRGDAGAAARRLRRVYDHAPAHDLAQLNLMTSHDTERLASLMHNAFPRAYDNGASAWDRGDRYDHERVERDDIERAGAAIAAMTALPGSFMLYNGDEFALPGADDPDNRRPIPTRRFDAPDAADAARTLSPMIRSLSALRQREPIARVWRFGAWSIDATRRGEGIVVRRQLDRDVVTVTISPRPGPSIGGSERNATLETIWEADLGSGHGDASSWRVRVRHERLAEHAARR